MKKTKEKQPKNKPLTIALEDLVIIAVLTFCENAAELGCPRDEDVDMWFRNLTYKKAYKVAEKMLDIIDRDREMATKET